MSASLLRNHYIGLLSVALGLLSLGCPPKRISSKRASRLGPHIATFTEAGVVTGIAPLAESVMVGSSSGIDLFEFKGKHTVHIGTDEGLPGVSVRHMARDRNASAVWIATDMGLAFYEQKSGSFSTVKDPPQKMADALAGLQAIAVDPTGGAWLGSESGLFHVSDSGDWTATEVNGSVSALLAQASGDVWAAVGDRAVWVKKDGKATSFGSEHGFELAATMFIVDAPDGEPVFVGETSVGEGRVAFRVGAEINTYRPSPDSRFWGAARAGDEIILAMVRGSGDGQSRRLYSLSGPGALRRDTMSLVSVSDNNGRSPYRVHPLAINVPASATVLSADASGDIYVGTRTVGTVRIVRKDKRAHWLRRNEITSGAVDLTVACFKKAECLLATGAGRAWRYDGERVEPLFPLTKDGKPAYVLAVARSDDGKIYSLYHEGDRKKIKMALMDDDAFEPVLGLVIEARGGTISFARFAPDGSLWVGLRVLDREKESVPYGVAITDPNFGTVAYYRQEYRRRRHRKARRAGILPVPNNATEVAFLGDSEVWLATTAGAARLRGEKIQLFNETNGLEYEILHGVVATNGGVVFAASRRGIAVYDGTTWQSPRALAIPANEVARGEDGRLWIGTDAGLVSYDGQNVRRITRRQGLLAGAVNDLAVDHFGRIWTRGPDGVSVVTP